MEALQRSPVPYLTLAEDALGPAVAADWIGKFVMLGRLAHHWSRANFGSQLVVILSVPVRDFAAVLVGCGWMTATVAPFYPSIREVLAALPPHAPARVVTQSKVLTERLGGVDIEKDRARFGTDWKIDMLRAVVPLEFLDTPRSQPAPQPGVISRMTGFDRDWVARLASPPQDLALVGTHEWLADDLTAFLGRGDELEALENILLPQRSRAATWSTRIYSASHLDVDLPPAEVRAVVLDGAPATKYLAAIESPVVVSIMDRSVADESVLEWVLNYRNTRGTRVSLEHDLRWNPPAGVEVLGFEVPL